MTNSRQPVSICYVIPTLDQSGAEKQLTLLVTHLPQDRYRIHVVALNRGGYYSQQLQDSQIPVTVIGKRMRVDPLAHFRLRSVINRIQPDIVHAWLFSANTHTRLLKNRRTKWKVVISERCVDTWKAGWQLQLDRRLIHRTDAMVANSESVAKFYRQIGFPRQKQTVIPNGIELPHLPDKTSSSFQQQRKAWLHKWGFPEDTFLIGSVGRLAPQKKLETVLWSMHMLRLVEPRARLLIVGDGPAAEQLQYLARQYEVTELLRFAGHCQNVENAYPFFDAFVLASDFEGQSNSLLEAMSWRVPVVASKIPPNQELIRHDENGYLFEVEDAAGLALGVRKLIADQKLGIQYSQLAWQDLQNRHSIEQMVDHHLHLYHHLLSHAGDQVARPESCAE